MPLDWDHDAREDHVDRYLGAPVSGVEDRLTTFVKEWKTELKRMRGELQPSRSATQLVNVTWQALAQECARIFRDIPIEHQETLFYI
ncbi:MAG: hypothetical protein H0X37_23795 [Herpetosiphonaceae bacterium]|nr:hypothetical protein [Herpetosiphonaceae bacterium]